MKKVRVLLAKQNLNYRGFTLLEILMVIAIMSILAGIIFVSFIDLNNSESLIKNTKQIAAIINQARAETLSSKGDTNYGVHFDSSQVAIFEGDTYSSGASTNIYTPLNSLVALSSINLAGSGNDIVFDRLTGKTSQPGSIVYSLVSTSTVTSTITVSGTGIVEVSN